MNKTTEFFTKLYTAESLVQIFLVCAFPLHLWSLLMAFRDFAWVAARTYVWDAIGLVSYALVFALAESIGVFLIVVCLGILVPIYWGMEKRTALIGTLYLVLAFWAIIAQIYSAFGYALPVWFVGLMWQTGHPARVYWSVLIFLVLLSTIVPVTLVLRKNTKNIFDNISLLSGFYLILDFIGIVIIIIRNIH